MHTRILNIVLAAALGLGMAQQALGDATASPGKAAAYTSVSGVPVGLSGGSTGVGVQILKGLKKRVLEVDVSATDTSASTLAMGIFLIVNGIPGAFQPTVNYQVEHGCVPGQANCTQTAFFWLDIDAAETANPGMFVNQPLNIDVNMAAGSFPAVATISVRARLVKK